MNGRTLLLGAALVAVPAFAGQGDKVIEGQAAAGDARRFQIDGGVGDLRITATDGDQVTWRLELEADPKGGWLFGRKHRVESVREALKGAEVRVRNGATRIELELVLPREVDEDDVRQHWTVGVPRALALDVEVDVGDIEIRGVTGGVKASVDVGGIDVVAPSGDIDLRVDVGDVELRLGDSAGGAIDLAADVGDVDLELAGRTMDVNDGYGPGASLRLSGKGKGEGTAVRVRVDVGDVDVVIDR